ncbi:MAG TPA: thermonuclease family protein [Bdellovibrionota bacterium]|nr:thermonuclease family protein [Bdellovibrionota bacterium]
MALYSSKRLAHAALWSLPLLYSLIPKGHLAPSPQVPPQELRLFIESCHDGDTCRAHDERGKTWRLRLAGIDAPEVQQRPRLHSERALARVHELTRGRSCRVRALGRDAYARSLALIWCDGIFVNETLVREGHAYAYLHLGFPESRFEWAERGERRAREQRLGIFSSGRRLQSPHHFRRQ